MLYFDSITEKSSFNYLFLSIQFMAILFIVTKKHATTVWLLSNECIIYLWNSNSSHIINSLFVLLILIMNSHFKNKIPFGKMTIPKPNRITNHYSMYPKHTKRPSEFFTPNRLVLTDQSLFKSVMFGLWEILSGYAQGWFLLLPFYIFFVLEVYNNMY